MMGKEMNKDAEENRFRKVMFSETTIIITVIMTAFTLFNWVTSPLRDVQKDIALIQKDIQVINSNHLTHLQNYAEEIKDIRAREEKEADENDELYKMIIDNQRMLKIHLGIDN